MSKILSSDFLYFHDKRNASHRATILPNDCGTVSATIDLCNNIQFLLQRKRDTKMCASFSHHTKFTWWKWIFSTFSHVSFCFFSTNVLKIVSIWRQMSSFILCANSFFYYNQGPLCLLFTISSEKWQNKIGTLSLSYYINGFTITSSYYIQSRL